MPGGTQICLLMAQAPVAIGFGILSLVLLLTFRRHRDGNGGLLRPRMVGSFLLGIALYTMTILVVANFFVGVPLSDMVRFGIGDDRLGWVFVGITADVFARYYSLFA